MGSGKTLYATRYAIRYFCEKGLYDQAFANYHIESPNPGRQVTLLDYDAFKSLSGLKNALVIIDEAYLWLDSRMSSSRNNRNVSYLVLQSRKRGFDILYTAQIKSSVDLRLRELSDVWVYCEHIKRAHKFIYTEVMRSAFIPRMREMDLAEKDAERIYPYFDTREVVINPFERDQKDARSMTERLSERLAVMEKRVRKLEHG